MVRAAVAQHFMKQQLVQMTGVVVSKRCRTYSFAVIDPSGTRQFTVAVSLELFGASPLKFQDGPLLTRERLIDELEREASELPASNRLDVSEPDIRGYMERHYPPKARTWNRYKQAASDL